MFVEILILFAAAGIGGFTARAARERGRRPGAWVALSVAAAVGGQLVALALLGWDISRYQAADSFGSVMFSMLAALVAPLPCMLAVLGVLHWLPVSTPVVGGTSWLVYRMSSGDRAGGNVQLRIVNGRVHLGDDALEAGEHIAADGECLRIAWTDGSAELLPIEKSRTPKERARWSAGLANRLHQIVELRR